MITREQLTAATALHARLKGWADADLALARVGSSFPSNTERQDVLVKATVVNGLYSIRVSRIYEASNHIVDLMTQIASGAWAPTDRVGFVHELAKVPKEKCRNGYELLTSFASKYAHFFVVPLAVGVAGDFPIYDSYAASALLSLTGESGDLSQRSCPYGEFCRMLDVVSPAEQGYDSREVDRYLWLKGQYLAFRNGRGSHLNKDVQAIFGSTDNDTIRLVGELAAQE